MKYLKIVMLSLLIFQLAACGDTEKNKNLNSAKSLFPKGEKNDSSNFSGITYRAGLMDDSDTFDVTVGSITFEPRARTNWHSHPNGQ